MVKSRTCSSCKEELPLDKFSVKNKSPDGLQYSCKQCCKKANDLFYQENKSVRREKLSSRKKEIQDITREMVYSILSAGCVDSPEKDIVVLDFDHITGVKKHNISYMVGCGYYPDAIKEELKKCVVRCANCHRRKTAKDFNWRRLLYK